MSSPTYLSSVFIIDGLPFIHDPRYKIMENTLESPMRTGGGVVVEEFGSILGDEWTPKCANVPRSFLNEESCFLSTAAYACAYRPTKPRSKTEDPSSIFYVDQEKLKQVYEQTGGGAPGTVYLYAVDGLRVDDDNTVTPPCQPRSRSRWVKGPCSANPGAGLGSGTVQFLELRLKQRARQVTSKFSCWYSSLLCTSW